MKNLLIAILLCTVSTAFAQSFEGTMKWSIKTEVTDPERKAQMEEAQKKMNDPATKAQMKEMESKMNDPQFKAMMDANPQMKEQMEKALAAIKGGGNPLTAMVPTGMEFKIKDQNVITKMEGGAFAMEMLYVKEKDQSYSIDRAKKTYSVLSQDKSDKSKSDATTKVTKTSETAKVLGYNCTKYVVEIQASGQTLKQYVWSTTELKDIDLTSLKKQRLGKDQKLFYEGMDGVPLRTELSVQGMNITSEVVDIKKQSLPATDFAIPAGFKEVPLSFRPQ